jgi:hypothetical protein
LLETSGIISFRSGQVSSSLRQDLDLADKMLVQFFCALQKLRRLALNLALDIELTAFDRNQRLPLSICRHDQTDLSQIQVNLAHSLINLVDIVFLAECVKIVALLLKSALDFKNV